MQEKKGRGGKLLRHLQSYRKFGGNNTLNLFSVDLPKDRPSQSWENNYPEWPWASYLVSHLLEQDNGNTVVSSKSP